MALVSSFKAHRRHGEAHGTEDGEQRPTPFKSRGLACCDWCADAAAIDPSWETRYVEGFRVLGSFLAINFIQEIN